jgi:hypothetical protein
MRHSALKYYAERTDAVEVVRNNRLERITFPVPNLCAFLTRDSKQKVYVETDVDEHGSKIPAFYSSINGLFEEMKWQMKLKSRPDLYQLTTNFGNWKALAFTFAILLNLIVAIYYPFTTPRSPGRFQSHLSFISVSLFALTLFFMLAIFAKRYHIQTYLQARGAVALPFLTGSIDQCVLAIRLFVTAFAFALCVHGHAVVAVQTLGFLQLINACVMLLSYLGNHMSEYVRDSASASEASGVDQVMVMKDPMLHYQVAYLCVALLSLVWDIALQAPPESGTGCLFNSLLLIDIVFYDATLWNVIRSVTYNGRSILLTACFALILVFLFSIAGFLYFQACRVLACFLPLLFTLAFYPCF